jgi:hypothetical protein
MSRYELDFLEQYTDEALLAGLRTVAALLPAASDWSAKADFKVGCQSGKCAILV